MYKLQIVGPTGQYQLQWDPQKLQAQDPETVAALAAADQLMKAALAKALSSASPEEGAETRNLHNSCLTACGRWQIQRG